jgi:L-alanine-DL-glutamate epimerase-like enolase superfamily enzyme
LPCYALLGGKVRVRVRVYWSHCATWRINHPSPYKPAITSLDGVKALGAEVREKGFTAVVGAMYGKSPSHPICRSIVDLNDSAVAEARSFKYS